jgi:DUF4097 and DUF4098 domain-containing protein YvlB
MMMGRISIATLLLLAAASAAQGGISRTFNADQTFGLAANGTFLLENAVGNVVIYAKDTRDVEAMIFKTIEGTDQAAVDDGRKYTRVIVGGDDNVRSVRTSIAPGSTREWAASVAWRVGVPRNANLRVITRNGDHINISGMRGTIYVRNFNGRIILDDVVGAASIESVNGSIFYTSPQLKANVTMTTVNGDVTATVPLQAGFRWIAETLKGDIKTNLPARGAFFGPTYRSTVNEPGGPTLSTGSLMGNVQLFAKGQPVRTARSVKNTVPLQSPTMVLKTDPPPTPIVRGPLFRYACNVCDVRVQQVLGDADIYTGAGEVQLGAVSGSLIVNSRGGPMQFGEIQGTMNVKTRAGDVLVDSARRGGSIVTDGGTIRLLFMSGPTRLYSGGGDITVRQAAAAVDAETASGDISITIDGRSKSQKVGATTAKGNVILNVTSGFGADVDATILTSDPEADTILSDIPGLSISRDTVNGRTRIRAVGRINGGGEKVTLHATDGDIRISTGPVAPTVVTRR